MTTADDDEPDGHVPDTLDQERDRRDHEGCEDEVVLRGGRLQGDHRERSDEQAGDERLRATEPERAADADHADDQRGVRGRLDEGDVPVGAAEGHRREHAELAVWWIGVDVRRAGAVRVSRPAVLQPESRTPEVIDDRVEVVLRCREAERDRVSESCEDDDAEYGRDGLGKSCAQRLGALTYAKEHVAPLTSVQGKQRTGGRERPEQPPTRDPVEARQQPEDDDELGPGDDVGREQERRCRAGRKQRGEAERSAREQCGGPGDRERADHRPLGEKCW